MTMLAKYFLDGTNEETTGLAYYNFEGNVNDSVGSLNLSNYGCTLTDDKDGNANSAYYFNGSSYYMTAPTSTTYDITNGSFEFILKLTSSTQTSRTLLDHWDETTGSGAYRGFSIFFGTDGTDKFQCRVRISSGNPGNITDNLVDFGTSDTSFHTLRVEIKDGNKTYIYFDDILIQSKLDHSLVSYSSNPTIYIGCSYSEFSTSRSSYFDGVIDSILLNSIAVDVSKDGTGNGNNGTSYNVTYINGKAGLAGSFNGSTSYISMGNKLQFTHLSTYSITAFIKNNSTANQSRIIGKNSNATSVGYGLIKTSTGYYSFYMYSGASGNLGVTFPSDYNDGKFHQIGVTYDGNNNVSGYKLYVDGAQVTATTNANIAITGSILVTDNFQISGRTGANNVFNGVIDNVEIHDTVLTATEIKNKYLFYNGFYDG